MVDYAWGLWTGTTGSTVQLSNAVWSQWTVTNATTSNPWQWVSSTPTFISYVPLNSYIAPRLSAAELARQRRVTRVGEEQARRWATERAAADAKATELLVSNLDEEQAEAYRRRREFEVIGSDGHRYKIARDRVTGLTRRRGNRPTSYCIHPSEVYPAEDNMLAKKLLLEADAPTFLRIANAS